MGSYIALIGSVVIAGVLLLNFWNFQADLRDHSYRCTNDLIVQQNAMEIIELLEWDFRKIGYGVPFPPLAVYDSNFVAYYVDFGHDGAMDTVRYFVSDTSAASSTPNPRDRIFYRLSNSEPQLGVAMGVTDFRLRYFDIDGNETDDLKKIKTIEVTLEMESTLPYNGEYSHYFWRERITPPNLLPW